METLIFGLAGLASYYPFYLLNKNKKDKKKVDAPTYNIYPYQFKSEGQKIIIQDGSMTNIVSCPINSDTTPNGTSIAEHTGCYCYNGYQWDGSHCVPIAITGPSSFVSARCPENSNANGSANGMNGSEILGYVGCYCDDDYTHVNGICISNIVNKTDPLFDLYSTLNRIIFKFNSFININTIASMEYSNLNTTASQDDAAILGTASYVINDTHTSVNTKAICRNLLNIIRSKLLLELNKISNLIDIIKKDLTIFPDDDFYVNIFVPIKNKVVEYYGNTINTGKRASMLINIPSDTTINQLPYNINEAFLNMNEKFSQLIDALQSNYNILLNTIEDTLNTFVPPITKVSPCVDNKIIVQDFISPDNAYQLLVTISSYLQAFVKPGFIYDCSDQSAKLKAKILLSDHNTGIGSIDDSTTFLGKYKNAINSSVAINIVLKNIITSDSIDDIMRSIILAKKILDQSKTSCNYILASDIPNLSNIQYLYSKIQSGIYDQLTYFINSMDDLIGKINSRISDKVSNKVSNKVIIDNNDLLLIKDCKKVYNLYSNYIDVLDVSFIHIETNASELNNLDKYNTLTNMLSYLLNIRMY